MAVTRLEIRSRQPYEGGVSFGEVGSYERIDGLLHFAVDPAHAANGAIVDLDKAVRDPSGLVAFSADFTLLQPADGARGNGGLLFEVVNRGRRGATTMFNNAERTVTATERIDPGDGFLMRQGWTIAAAGWQWDVIRDGVQMGLDAPTALENGQPISGTVLVRFQPNARANDHLLADRIHQPYRAANVHDRDARLLVGDWADGAPTTLPRDQWRFARDEGGVPVAADTHVWLDGGFEPGKVYEVVYRTNTCPVVGTGLLAVRDTMSFLRHGAEAGGNPAAGRLTRALGFGQSQCGRFLRTLLFHGLNVDEQGRQVFDGLLPHICGAWRGQFNHRFAQPSEQRAPGFSHLPPFHDTDQTDPVTGLTDSLLRRQRAAGGVPKVFYTNTAAEYWRGDGSLIHTDMAGERDVEPATTTRTYFFAGTQHGAGTLPFTDLGAPPDPPRAAHRLNVVDYRPLMRAALANLDRWVREGVEPPANVFPRLSAGEALPAREVAAAFRRFPTATAPDPALVPQLHRLDLGPQAEEGVGRFPAVQGDLWPTSVPAPDEDGNDRGGIRLPDVAVPVATFTGWNPRHADIGGPGQILPMLGSTIPFAVSAAERAASGDPRPAIAERYRDRDDYAARLHAAAEALAAQRFLLPEDIDLAVANALARYDALVPAAAGV